MITNERQFVIRAMSGDVSIDFNSLTVGATITEVFAIKDFEEVRKDKRLIGIVTKRTMIRIAIDLAEYALLNFAGTKDPKCFEAIAKARKFLNGKSKVSVFIRLCDDLRDIYSTAAQISNHQSPTNRVTAMIWALSEWLRNEADGNAIRYASLTNTGYKESMQHFWEACGPNQRNFETKRVRDYIVAIFESGEFLFDLN